MKRILIVYNTVSGSTAEMADIIKTVLEGEYSVDVTPVTGSPSIDKYDAVILGSPMRFGGFSRPIRKFIKKNRSALRGMRVFYFLSILYIVKIEQEPLPGFESYIDPSLSMRTIPKKTASLFDAKHSLWYYNSIISKAAGGLKPSSVGYMHGRLVIHRLGLIQKIFMKIITRITKKEREGEFMNPAAVKEWAYAISMILKKPGINK